MATGNAPLVAVEAIWQPFVQQRIFRDLLTALSFPGRIIDLGAKIDGGRCELGVLAALVDEQVTVSDPQELLSSSERRLLNPGRFVGPEEAEYILADGRNVPPENFQPNRGTIYRPEEGALLVLICDRVAPPATPSSPWETGDVCLHLTGPGIASETLLLLTGVHPDWLAARQTWCNNYPTGVDIVFCDRERIAALPRTSTVVVSGSACVKEA